MKSFAHSNSKIVINLFKGAVLSSLVLGCGNGEDMNNVSQPTLQDVGSPSEGTPQPIGSLNAEAYLLASSKGEFYRISASTGSETLLFDFGNYNIEPIGPADVIGTTAFITAEDNTLNAIDVNSGEFLWDIILGEDSGRNADPTPVICNSTVCYVMGDTGILFAVDIQGSKVLWQSALHPNGDSGEKLIGTPLLVAGDHIFLGAYMHDRLTLHSEVSPRLLVIDRTSGRILRNIAYSSPLSGAPAASANTLIVSTLSGVQALELTNYSVKWEVPGVQVTPALIQGNNVLFNAVDNNLQTMPYTQSTVSYDIQTGERQWVVNAGRGEYIYTPTSDGQRVYSVFMDDFLCDGCRRADASAIDINNGNLLWTQNLSVTYTPVAAKGSLFYSDMRSAVGEPSGFGAVNAATGTLDWINTRINFSGNDYILVQDGITYGRTTYPDAID